ncbi:MAG TPA: hypothetical protein VIM00_15100 [Candidatus Acidoferrum sp.]
MLPSFTARNDIYLRLDVESFPCLGVAQAARDDQRIPRDHRRDAKYNQIFHFFVWLIFLSSKGERSLVRRSPVPDAAVAGVTPYVAPATWRFGHADTFRERGFQACEGHRLSQTILRAVCGGHRMEVSFFKAREDDNRRRWTPRIQRFQGRHAVHSRIDVEHDDGDIGETVLDELKKRARCSRKAHIEIDQRCGGADDTGRVDIGVNE